MTAEPNIIGGILGGALIGLAAALLLLLHGRIAGVSGILGGLLFAPSMAERSWRLAFVLGLIVGAGIYSLITGSLPVQLQADTPTLIIAGFLVGVGTRLGAGCTSGHGVCGIARRSPRSLVATATFMLAGVVTVFLVRELFS